MEQDECPVLLRNHEDKMTSSSTAALGLTSGQWPAQESGCIYDPEPCVILKSIFPHLSAIAVEEMVGDCLSEGDSEASEGKGRLAITEKGLNGAKQLSITESMVKTTSMAASVQFLSVLRISALATTAMLRYPRLKKKIDMFFQNFPKNRGRAHTAGEWYICIISRWWDICMIGHRLVHYKAPALLYPSSFAQHHVI